MGWGLGQRLLPVIFVIMNAARRSLGIRVIYAVCLLGAAFNHASILVAHGVFWDYGGMPKASAVFWTALTVIDPAAAVLLFLRPNAGIATTAAIIVVDVIHNLGVGKVCGPCRC
jgi:hypothetical protein